MDQMKKNKLIDVAMQIILHAGNARLSIQDALCDAKTFAFEKAQQKMNHAQEEITLAHQAQTEVIQKEASGISYNFTLLFVHAQDTLMTIHSEFRMANELIDILKLIEHK